MCFNVRGLGRCSSILVFFVKGFTAVTLRIKGADIAGVGAVGAATVSLLGLKPRPKPPVPP